MRNFKTLGTLARAGIVWMFAELALCFLWRGNGSDFAYRYLIGSYAGALMVWLEFLGVADRVLKRVSESLLLLNAFWLFWLAWIYKEHVDVLPIPDQIGNWSLEDLQLNSLSALFDPSFYLLPLRHSPIAALYNSWINPAGLSSFSEGPNDFRFWLCSLATILAILGLVVFGYLIRKSIIQHKDSMSQKSSQRPGRRHR